MTHPTDLGLWRRTSPFAIVFFLGATVRTIARSYLELAASFGAIAYLSRFLPGEGSLGMAVALVLLAIVVVALMRYWFFRFRLEEDRVLIRQGFVRRTALDLPFDRVQGINVERSLVDRVLGLVTVRLDTAGSMVAEGRLPSVSTELADWLRGRVDPGRKRQREGARTKPAGDGARRPAAADDDRPAADHGERDASATGNLSAGVAPAEARRAAVGAFGDASGRMLLRLTSADMIRIGLSDRKALVLAGALAALSQFVEPFFDRFLAAFDGVWNGIVGLGSGSQLFAAAVLTLGGVLALLLVMVAGAFLRHHDFTVWKQGAAFRSRAGLLTQKEVVVESVKIQQVTLSQNIVQRWFGRYRLSALPAGAVQMPGSEAAGGLEFAENLEVPLVDGRGAEGLRGEVLGDEAAGLALLPDHPLFKRISSYHMWLQFVRLIRAPLLPPFLVGAVFIVNRSGLDGVASIPFAVWTLGWLMLAAAIAVQGWRRFGYLHDDEGMTVRRGFIGRRTDAFLFRKAQGVVVRTSPMQRRRGLATLDVHLASGALSIPCIDQSTAHRLRDHILYTVESTRRPWH